MEDNPLPKVFNDPIHGHIEMPRLLVKIIDTPQFQRLRNIKQFGGGYYVYPGASHNRFEHSIGVAHLAGKLVQRLRTQEDLGITDIDELCVQIAGLCHDLGHGPFSHAFDEVVQELKKEKQEEEKKETKEEEEEKNKWKHEAASVKMFDHLIKENGIDDIMKEHGFKEEDFKFIKELIHHPPSKNGGLPTSSQWPYKGRTKEKSFLYQIVANHTTGIDVDKMDYFSRDCHHLGMKSNFSHERYMMFARVCTDENGEKQICVRDKEAMNMYELFQIRNLIRKNACHHRVATAVELMIVDALKAAAKSFKLGDKKLTILEAVDDPETYMYLTDDILQQILRSPDENLRTAQDIIRRILKRDLYKFIGGKIFDPAKLKHLMKNEKEWKEELLTEKLNAWLRKVKEVNGDQQLKAVDFKVLPINFNYGMEEKNPIDALRFYRRDKPDISIQLSKDEVSYLLPEKFAEIKVMVFYKGENTAVEDLTEHIKEFWNYLDPVFAVVNNPSTYMDLSVVKPDLLQQFRHSAEEKTERFLKQRSYKIIAEKIFNKVELKQFDSEEQWKVKVEAWLDDVQKPGGKQPKFTADDFKVVHYSLPDKTDSTKVLLLYKGLPEEDTEKFWEEVLKDLKLSASEKKTITYVDLIDGKPLAIICLLISAAHGIIEELLKQGFFIFEEKIFKAEHLKHLQSDDQWKEKLKAWLKNVQKKAGGKQPARNVADFKVISYALPGQPNFINVMLFYKGLHKEEIDKLWHKV
ncbi:deoxynucleoside triphosphate triphosphohydrolase SAMHD1-like [Colossoma macropomum]|uniref:deoxynucleoside triphosphate triphosphohydrolase SAMHD1-like n=1 Tax=Colossoma macropomum TaxID=42526 RepID=UPI0018643127|nr:deoxynucleoside triphosphate triphosphohydrolase SAMHD1-like [Colossoma macropomum]